THGKWRLRRLQQDYHVWAAHPPQARRALGTQSTEEEPAVQAERTEAARVFWRRMVSSQHLHSLPPDARQERLSSTRNTKAAGAREVCRPLCVSGGPAGLSPQLLGRVHRGADDAGVVPECRGDELWPDPNPGEELFWRRAHATADDHQVWPYEPVDRLEIFLYPLRPRRPAQVFSLAGGFRCPSF